MSIGIGDHIDGRELSHELGVIVVAFLFLLGLAASAGFSFLAVFFFVCHKLKREQSSHRDGILMDETLR